MPYVTVTRRLTFNAAHRVHNPQLSDDENQRLFGKCNNPNWHGHNYSLEVSVAGEVDERTGYVIDLAELKRIVEAEVVGHIDHRNLNVDVEFMRGIIPRPRTSWSRAGASSSRASRRGGSPSSASGKRKTTMSTTMAANGSGTLLTAAFDPESADDAPAGHDEMEALVRRQLELLGEDPDRDGLLKTPSRVAKSLAWLTRGHALDARTVIGDALFEETHENMVMVRDIELYSMCEHHMLPFFGKAHIAYIPNGRIVGLSKLPRVVEVFARRLQVQERLTEQVAQALQDVLQPLGVGVVIEAVHLCMMMRGVEKQNSKTITSALKGSFRDDAATRDEFLRLAYGTPAHIR
jgi:GTP cyclohydrolase I